MYDPRVNDPYRIKPAWEVERDARDANARVGWAWFWICLVFLCLILAIF